MMCDGDITVEVLELNDEYSIGSITLHETIMMEELTELFDFSIKRAECMNNSCKKIEHTEFNECPIIIILTKLGVNTEIER